MEQRHRHVRPADKRAHSNGVLGGSAASRCCPAQAQPAAEGLQTHERRARGSPDASPRADVSGRAVSRPPLTAFAWRELWGVNELLWGDHFSAIRYDRAARIVGFEPKMPWQTDVQRRNGSNLYRFETPVPGGNPKPSSGSTRTT
jgi:hypothetical protein